jgi:hypothetical protein
MQKLKTWHIALLAGTLPQIAGNRQGNLTEAGSETYFRHPEEDESGAGLSGLAGGDLVQCGQDRIDIIS